MRGVRPPSAARLATGPARSGTPSDEILDESIRSVAGVWPAPDAHAWRPDDATRHELRVLTAHIGAHPPVVGADPATGRWPGADLGVGVTAWWDPDLHRPLRWQRHVCRRALHAKIDDVNAAVAPTFVLHRDRLWLVEGHHDLWLIVAARTSRLAPGPVAANVHLPGGGRHPPPELTCPCPDRPRFAPRELPVIDPLDGPSPELRGASGR